MRARLRGVITIALLAMGCMLAFSPALAAITLRPLGDVESIPIGRAAKPYLVLGPNPVTFPLLGPGTVTVFARVPMPTDDPTTRRGTLIVSGLGSGARKIPLEFRPSRSASWPDTRPGAPSAGAKTTLEIPAGEHQIQLQGTAFGGDPMLAILYYNGPEQPEVPGLQPLVTSVNVQSAAGAKKKSSWSLRGNAGLDIIYNDNILTNSPDYMNDFITGSYPWKFTHKTNDDLVVAPSFDIEARRDLISWGQSRFKFKVKVWKYTHNPIKTNTDFHFYGRQYFGKNKSLEAYFHFAPEQYIRQLSDRSPLDDPDADINWKEFRFQRNVWNLTWRQKISKKLSVKFLYEENFRYYNQPFMENDISAWEVRGNATCKFNRTYTLNLDYSYEDGKGRGLDEPGENILNSDNSDSSYKRDLYRVGLTMKYKVLKPIISQADFSFLFMDYYYPTTKSLAQDPYHAGRNDTYYKVTFEVRRKIAKPVTLKLAVRRTERIVFSPWEGDITTDKDFTQWLYWVNLSYRF